MKLLFDQNLSRFLVARLGDLFPDSTHVVLAGLDAAPDSVIWTFAAEHGFVLVTKDRDFLGFTPGSVPTPSLVLLTLGNCPTGEVEELLRHRRPSIEDLATGDHRLLILPSRLETASMPPLIAVTTSMAPESDGRPDRATLNGAYLRAIQAAGGAPMMLAPQFGQASIVALVAATQGLVLTGGGDVLPALYGQDAHPSTSGISVERDRMEVEALGIALERGLPVLAICRGMQVLNVAMGGSLLQDLPSLRPSDVDHAQTSGGAHARDAVTHAVHVEAASCLATVLGAVEIRTNSMHHQALDRPGNGVAPVAWASDGLIEGVEMPGERWVFGIQWHPEELFEQHAHARQLFAAFIAACDAT